MYSSVSSLRKYSFPLWCCWILLLFCVGSIVVFFLFFYRSMPNLNRLAKWIPIQKLESELNSLHNLYQRRPFQFEVTGLPDGVKWDKEKRKLFATPSKFGNEIPISILIESEGQNFPPHPIKIGVNDPPRIQQEKLHEQCKKHTLIPNTKISFSLNEILSSGDAGEISISIEKDTLKVFSISSDGELHINIEHLSYEQIKNIQEVRAELRIQDYILHENNGKMEKFELREATEEIVISVQPIFQLDVENLLLGIVSKKILLGKVQNYHPSLQWKKTIHREQGTTKQEVKDIQVNVQKNGEIYLDPTACGKYKIELSVFPSDSQKIEQYKVLECTIYDPPAFLSAEDFKNQYSLNGTLEMEVKKEGMDIVAYIFRPIPQPIEIPNLIVPGVPVPDKILFREETGIFSEKEGKIFLDCSKIKGKRTVVLTAKKRDVSVSMKIALIRIEIPNIPSEVRPITWKSFLEKVPSVLSISSPGIEQAIGKDVPCNLEETVSIRSKVSGEEISTGTTRLIIDSVFATWPKILNYKDFREKIAKVPAEYFCKIEGNPEEYGINNLTLSIFQKNTEKQVDTYDIIVIRNDPIEITNPKMHIAPEKNDKFFYGKSYEKTLVDGHIINRYGSLSLKVNPPLPDFCRIDHIDQKLIIDLCNVTQDKAVQQLEISIHVSDSFSSRIMLPDGSEQFATDIQDTPNAISITIVLPEYPLLKMERKTQEMGEKDAPLIQEIARIYHLESPILTPIDSPKGFRFFLEEGEKYHAIKMECEKEKETGIFQIPVEVKISANSTVLLKETFSLKVVPYPAGNIELEIRDVCDTSRKILKQVPKGMKDIFLVCDIRAYNCNRTVKEYMYYDIKWNDVLIVNDQKILEKIENGENKNIFLKIPVPKEVKLGKNSVEIFLYTNYFGKFVSQANFKIPLFYSLPKEIRVEGEKLFRIQDGMEMQLFVDEHSKMAFLIDCYEVSVEQYRKFMGITTGQLQISEQYRKYIQESFSQVVPRTLPEKFPIYYYESDLITFGSDGKLEFSRREDILKYLLIGPAFYFEDTSLYDDRNKTASLYPDGRWPTSAGIFYNADIKKDRANFPVIGVSLWEANAYARFCGARLPRKAEIEFVLGTVPSNRPNTLPLNQPVEVDQQKGENTIAHLIGNVNEWLDIQEDDTYTEYGWSFQGSSSGFFRHEIISNRVFDKGFRCVIPVER